MARRDRPQSRPRRRSGNPWAFAAGGLLLLSLAVLLFNQQHSGDPLKVRRELRKF